MSVHAERAAQVRASIRIKVFTIVWMSIEALVSVGAGVWAGSALLIAFGLDSVIELVSGAILLWRLALEARGETTEQVERAEQRAAWVVAIALVLLCLYVLVTALYGLIHTHSPGGLAGGHPDRYGGSRRDASTWCDKTPFGDMPTERSLARRCCQFVYVRVHGSYRAPWSWPQYPLPLVVGRSCGGTGLPFLACW
jgi:hypothetical protein